MRHRPSPPRRSLPSRVRPRTTLLAGWLCAAWPLLGPSSPGPEAAAQEIVARRLARGLEFPAALAVAPDGRIFYGEIASGEIRVLDLTAGTNRLFFTIPDVVSAGERGLLDLAFHPRYPTRPFVYAFVSRDLGAGPRSHVVRLRDTGGTGGAMAVLFEEASTDFHNGSRIQFGPDGMLYVSIGDGGPSRNAQDLESARGKILRLTPGGGIPLDNPFPGSPVFAYGLRNSFGLAFDPLTGRLWSTDNGPRCNDELNRIRPGANYGWGPRQTCDSPPPPPRNTNRDGPDPVLPASFYNPSIAPTGVVFCSGCALGPASEGALFFGAFITREIRRVRLDASRRAVASQAIVLTHPNPILSMEPGPDGTIYFSTPTALFELEPAS